MATNNNLSDLLTSIANAIRTKKDTTEPINAQNFASEIESISSGASYKNYVIFNKLSNVKFYLDTDVTIIPTGLFRIGADFGYNNSAKEIHLETATIVNGFAFANNESLTTVYLPECTTIQGGSSFSGCKTLTSIELPSITSISNGSFTSCSALKKVVIGTNESTSVCTLGGTSAFNNTPIATSETEGFIYVADSLVDQYKEATNWVTYATKIKGISDLPVEG